MDRPEWICSDQRTDGSGICPVATEGNLFLRLRFWITSSKCLVLFLCPWLIKVLGTFLLYILLLPPPTKGSTHTYTLSQSERKRYKRNLAKCWIFRWCPFSGKITRSQCLLWNRTCNDSIKYPEPLTFNNLIDFFKCLLNVSLFKFFFRA